jgi:iron complex transport system permease protein
MLVGMALSVSGAAYQGMFRNPLVSPDILGASAGAGFGAALGILLSLNILNIQLLAFGFGSAAVFLVYLISGRIKRGDPTLVLVLTGILIGTVFTSLISIIKFVADPYDKLPAITFWLMGSLASINTTDIAIAVVPILFGGVMLFLLRWRLNTLSFGEEEARTLGVNTGRTRFVIIVSATLMTAAAVSIAGMIGWIGLVVPHLARAVVGPNHKVLIPAAAIMGSTFLLLVDDIARIVTPLELPLGVMTSLIGAPLFIYLLASTRKGWL